MSRASYTASERRGVLAIAIIALFLIGFGVCFSLCGRSVEAEIEMPAVEVHHEMIDSAALLKSKEKKTSKKTKKKSSSSKSKNSKSYRHRSPLDEPV